MRYIYIIISLVLFSGTAFSQFNNYRIYPSNVNQTEVFVVTSPLDDNTLFASCNTLTFIPFFISEGVYVSQDHGQSWLGNDTCTGEILTVHGGDPGIAIDKDGTLIMTRLGRTPFTGLYSHYSTDNGQSWSAQQVISTDDLERASIATDHYNSVFYGTTYAVWVKFAPPFPMMFAKTSDGGKTWSEPMQINDPPSRCAGGDIAIGPHGEILVCWAGVTETSPFKETHVGVARSTDGGMSWEVDEVAFEVNGVTGLLEDKGNIRINGLPQIAVNTSEGPMKGWAFIVTGQIDKEPAGSDPDIILYHSVSNGTGWGSPKRINQDELNNGKNQYFPSVHVDKENGINVIYYDDRNTSSDSAGVFLARSTNFGLNWSEFEISDHNHKPIPIGGLGQGYMGDNIDITSTSESLWPVWMDNSSGLFQIWTTQIDYEMLGIADLQSENPYISLQQNYPNPFSGHTTINYTLKHKGYITLSLYDITGKQIKTFINATQSKGDHSITIPRAGLKSGIYYYQLQMEGVSLTRKMVVY